MDKPNKFAVNDKVYAYYNDTTVHLLLTGIVLEAPDTEDDGDYCYPYNVAFENSLDPGVLVNHKMYAGQLFRTQKDCVLNRIAMHKEAIEQYRKSIQNLEAAEYRAKEQLKNCLRDLEKLGVCLECDGVGKSDIVNSAGEVHNRTCYYCDGSGKASPKVLCIMKGLDVLAFLFGWARILLITRLRPLYKPLSMI